MPSPGLRQNGTSSSKASSMPLPLKPTSQARFGYLGYLSLKEGNAQTGSNSVRNLVVEGSDFLPTAMVLQREVVPWQFNTPVRIPEEPINFGDNEQTCSSQGEKSKSSPMKQQSLQPPLPTNYVRRVRHRVQQSLHNEAASWMQRIADLKLLASSSTRAGNINSSMQAYHNMGIVYDNEGMYEEAMKVYKHFLCLATTSSNSQGEALAYNCLGIDAFKLGLHDEAIQYLHKHLECTDSAGRLMAHTNLGIVFQAMGLYEHAAIHHQHAIEYANRMGAKAAQCFSVGNLGMASAAQGDLQTSRICLEYHLQALHRQKQQLGGSKFMQRTLKDVKNRAHHRLGQVNTAEGCLEEASQHFAKAIEVAKVKGDQVSQDASTVMFGIAEGMKNFDEHCDLLVKTDFDHPGDDMDHHGISR